MRFDSYSGSVAKLLTYGQPKPHQPPQKWPDYVQELGLSQSDISELLRLMLDPAVAKVPSNHVEVWASLHAWRALGQLKAVEAIEPLLKLLGDEADDWVTDEIPWVYGLIGSPAISVLAKYLGSSSKPVWGRMTTISSLRAIAELHPEVSDRCSSAMAAQLREYHCNPEELNGLLIVELVELKTVDAAELIEQAYQSHCVDELMAGTWPDCQVRLGLKARSDFPEEAFTPKMPPELEEIKRLGQLGDMLAATESPASLSDTLPQALPPVGDAGNLSGQGGRQGFGPGFGPTSTRKTAKRSKRRKKKK